MERKTNEEIEIDLLELYHVVKSNILLIILTGVLMATGMGLISAFILTPKYDSIAKIYILNKSNEIASLSDLQAGTQLTQDYLVLVKSRPVVTTVINNLDLITSYDKLADCISVSNTSGTRILEIKVEYTDPYLAKKIVDELADVSITRIANIMSTDKPTLIEEGYIPEEPSSPNAKRNAIIGFALGIIVAACVIVVLYILDDTIKDDDDVEKYLAITTLGLIPIEAGTEKQIEADRKKRRKNLRIFGKKEKR